MINAVHIAGGLLALGTLGSGWACGPERAPRPHQPESIMENAQAASDSIEVLMEEADWTAVQVAQAQGPAVVGQVAPYLDDDDELVRLLAVDCIVIAGGPEAPDLLIGALDDEDDQVRIHAVNGLYKNLPTGREAVLLAVLRRTDDAFLRQQLPLLLGLLGASSVQPELQALYQREPDAEAQAGFRAALAKLGDRDARYAFARALERAEGRDAKDRIDEALYIDQDWVLRHFLPLLTRTEIAVDLSTHRTELRRRTCDLAVDAVIDLSEHRFRFEKDPLAQYTDDQIAEVARYLRDRIEEDR